MQAQKGDGDKATTHSQPGTRGRWLVSITLWPLYPTKDPVPIVQGAGWASGPVWTAWKILPTARFEPWTVQTVASNCTNYDIPDTRYSTYGMGSSKAGGGDQADVTSPKRN
jgi:hypothetical protein